jgi:hypothetical protein
MSTTGSGRVEVHYELDPPTAGRESGQGTTTLVPGAWVRLTDPKFTLQALRVVVDAETRFALSREDLEQLFEGKPADRVGITIEEGGPRRMSDAEVDELLNPRKRERKSKGSSRDGVRETAEEVP